MKKISVTLSKQSGASLIEVMVALLILGVGLLGAMSLQTKGLNSNTKAVFATEAHILAEDMAHRIMAYGSTDFNGSAGALGGEYAATDTGVKGTVAYANPNCTSGAGCTPANTVTYDRHKWEEAINNSSLPSGQGTVTWAAAPATAYTITILWDQNRTGAVGTDCDSNDKDANLSCYILTVDL
jgi:type IV pilus assembly protein PilV